MNHFNRSTASALALLAALWSAPAFAQSAEKTVELGISDADYSLERLIEEARKEPPLTVSDTTSQIVEQVKAFSAKYGIQATGVKIARNDQVQVVAREARAKAVQTDVLFMADSASALGFLLPQGYVTSWTPPDLASDIPEVFRNPLMVIQETAPFTYNTEVYGETCPVDNMWALTDEKWRGKFAIPDPQVWDYIPYWWNELATTEDDKVRAAYEAHYGKPLETSEASATAQWVKDVAKNNPQVMPGDPNVADAVGAPGQKDPFIGIMHTAKFRDNVNKGYKLGLCASMTPYAGVAYPKAAVIAVGTDSPNAAKLFVHYMLTQEGIAPQVADGKKSANSTIAIPDDEPSGIAKHWDKLYSFKPASLPSDLQSKQDWLDLWVASK